VTDNSKRTGAADELVPTIAMTVESRVLALNLDEHEHPFHSEFSTLLGRASVRIWHEPSLPATAGVGPEVGVELPMLPAGHRLSAMEGRPSVAGKPSSRQPVTHLRHWQDFETYFSVAWNLLHFVY
jgi:hypothetical protein